MTFDADRLLIYLLAAKAAPVIVDLLRETRGHQITSILNYPIIGLINLFPQRTHFPPKAGDLEGLLIIEA